MSETRLFPSDKCKGYLEQKDLTEDQMEKGSIC